MKEKKDELEKIKLEQKKLEQEKERLEEEKERLEREREELEKEKLAEKFEKTEFNNEIEDEQIRKSEKQKEILTQNKPLIIIGIVLVSIILLGALILFLNEKMKQSNNNLTPNEERKNSSSSENEKAGFYKTNHGKLYFDKYLYNDDSKEIMNIAEGKTIKIDEKYHIFLGQDSLYVKTHTGNLELQKVSNNKLIPIFEKKYQTEDEIPYIGNIVNKEGKLLGIYDNSKKNGSLYLLEKDSYRKITLNGLGIFGFANGGSENKEVYENDYIITYDRSKNNTYTNSEDDKQYLGIYDIKNEKELIKPIYEVLVSIGDKKWIAKKDGKTGIIDVNGKILLDFKYSFIEKKGDYYIVNKENGIVALDSNYKEVSDVLETNTLPYHYYLCCGSVNYFSSFTFEKNLLIRIEKYNPEYYYLDNHTFKKLGTGNLQIVENYLFFQNQGETKISIYNKSLDKAQEIELGESMDYWKFYLFLKEHLVAIKKGDTITYKFYTISKGQSVSIINSYERTYEDYLVRFTFTDRNRGKGTITIFKSDKLIGSLENADFIQYMSTKNNGISIKGNRIIYHTENKNGLDDILIID